MTDQAHRRVLTSILVALCIWPAVHEYLVREYDVSPWKLLGFAMYCTPHVTTVEVWDTSADVPRHVHPVDMTPQELKVHDDFVHLRNAIGKLADPRPVARALLSETGSRSKIRIRIGVTRLHAESRRRRTSWLAYDYSRPRANGTAAAPGG